MGWASGSAIMNAIIDAVKPHVAEKEARKAIYTPIINALEDGDWDTQDESMERDDAFDEALTELHPKWFQDDEE